MVTLEYGLSLKKPFLISGENITKLFSSSSLDRRQLTVKSAFPDWCWWRWAGTVCFETVSTSVLSGQNQFLKNVQPATPSKTEASLIQYRYKNHDKNKKDSTNNKNKNNNSNNIWAARTSFSKPATPTQRPGWLNTETTTTTPITQVFYLTGKINREQHQHQQQHSHSQQ